MAKKLFWGLVVVAALLQIYIAVRFQSRAWIDEIWVTFNPAFKLLYGVGELDVDWADGVRSWLAPFGLKNLLNILHGVGISNGNLVLPLIRVLLSLVTLAAKLFFIFAVSQKMNLKARPWLALLFIGFAPEFLRYSTFGELSSLALPFLLAGLAFIGVYKKTVLGLGLIALACALRYPFVVVLGFVGVYFLVKKEYRSFALTVLATLAFVLFDFAINSFFYGRSISPFLHYAYVDIIEGKPARDGVTPFYFTFELLWRFMTEPLLLASIFGLAVSWKKSKFLWGACLSLLLLHTIFGHKEYRYFYPIAVLLASLAGVGIQKWWEEKDNKPRTAIVTSLAISFMCFALWRGFYKTRWTDYQIPSSLETWVGTQSDVSGLLVYGWNGIYSGGHYTFHRTLPYSYAQNVDQLRLKNLAPDEFNYVITSESEAAPCAAVVRTAPGAFVYHCRPEEIRRLLGASKP